jgi:microsomal dipeptidase-like Zn-dependent dipeptidase
MNAMEFNRDQRWTQEKIRCYLLSLEGADSILSWRHLERSRADGLIALGPVHYGPGIYGCGTDDEGPLTAKGRELLKEMERLGIILDVTHLCDESMRDSLDHFSGPVWASHHNCRALANWNRQLTDEQIMELVQRGAVIGMAFDAIMMVHGWHHKVSKPQEFGLRIEKSASTLTTSASSPATRATSASAPTSTAATAPSRRLSISTASPTSRSSTISSRSAATAPPTSPGFPAGTSSASSART